MIAHLERPIDVNGEVWGWELTDLDDTWGECCIDTRMIRIHQDTHGRSELNTCIHEMLHAQHPGWDHRKINQRAREMTDFLWEYGYRCQRTITE